MTNVREDDCNTWNVHYANPDETTFVGACFEFHFGAYGSTVVRVYQRPDCLDDALETAAEWLKENEPGHFVEPDYEAAQAAIGETGGYSEAVMQAAETDLTYTESGWLNSAEWTVNELEGDPLEGASHFDRFDICLAYASYWSQWHQGQGSDGYRALCRATAIVRGVKGFDSLPENAKAIYRGLVLQDGR